MFQFKKIAKLPLILIQCECGREFLQEEMYCCLSCQISMCRYCTSNEIFCYYCRNCGDMTSVTDPQKLTVNCGSCFECPVCRNILKRSVDTEKNYCFTCTYCFYTTRSISLTDPNYANLYKKINEAYKQEYENELNDFSEQYSRISKIESAQAFQKKQQKNKHIIKQLTSSQQLKQSNMPITHLSNQEIENINKEKQEKIKFQRDNLELTNKQILLQDFVPTQQQQTPLPIPLGLLCRKNRKCRKCSKLIISLQNDKNSKKFMYSVQNIHYEYAPYLQIGKISYANKDKSELSVQIHMSNKTKNSIEFSINPLDSMILEQFKLLTVKNLPSPTFNIEYSDSDVQQVQKFEAILLIKDATKIQFAFSITEKIKIQGDLQILNFNVNVYIGTL